MDMTLASDLVRRKPIFLSTKKNVFDGSGMFPFPKGCFCLKKCLKNDFSLHFPIISLPFHTKLPLFKKTTPIKNGGGAWTKTRTR